jgi:hypothetical protein
MRMAIEVAIKILAYLLLFFGIWKLTYPLWIDQYRMKSRSIRLSKRKKASVQDKRSFSDKAFFSHIRKLIFSQAKNPNEYKVWNFYGLSIVLLVTTSFSIILVTGQIVMGILIGIMFMLIPYSLLRFHSKNARLSSALAFMQEFHLLLQGYQRHKDVYQMVFETTPAIRDKRLRITFNRLLSSLQKDRTESSFMEAVHLFSYSIGGSYAARFSNLLIKSYRDQYDVSEAMMDLYKDLRKREKDMAALKTKRMETILLGFMPAVFLPVFIFTAYRMTMMYSNSFILKHNNSFIALIFSIVLAVISALSSYLMSKPRADL